MSEPRTATGRKMVAIHGSALLDDVLGVEAEAASDDMLVCAGCGDYIAGEYWHEGCAPGLPHSIEDGSVRPETE